MNVSSFIPLIGLVSFGILLVVIGQHYRRRVNRAFALYLITMAVWAFGSFMMHANFFHHDTPFWNKFMIAVAFWSPVMYFRFIRIYLNETIGKNLLKVGYLLGTAFSVVILSGDAVVRHAYVKDGIYHGEFTPLLYGISFVGALFLFMVIWALVRQYRRTKDRATRNRLTYLFAGFGIVMGVSITNLAPALASYPIDQGANVINASLITYAVVKYKLLDVRFVIRKGIVYSSLTIVITSLYLLLVFALQRVFQATTGHSTAITAVVAAIIIAVLFQPLRDICQRWVDKLFYREAFDHRSMFKAATQVMIEILDLNELSSKMVNLVATTLKIKDSCLVILKGNRYVCLPQAKVGFQHLHAREIVFRRDNPIVRYLEASGNIIATDDIARLHQMRSLWKREREQIDKLGTTLFVALKARQQLAGLLLVGPKLSQEPYTPDEVELLSAVSGQMAIALDNARLYEESKRAYKELRVAHERLVRSEKLTALGVLASGVAHDFNNMLTAILGRAQMTLGRQIDPKVRSNLEIIEQAAVDAAGMVRKLQHFARVRTDSTFDIVDISETLKSALEMIKPRLDERREAFGSGIEIALDVEDTSPIKGDASELREALINIFINAIDAMPDGGKLNIRSAQDNGFVVISISDTGVGMTTEVRRRLFDPFFTTKGQNGLGMGLSVVYGVVKRHGGEIDVSSKPQKGSTFTIRIPVTEKHMEDITVEFNQNSTKNATILVVDDDKGSRDVLYEMLINNECRVDIAGSGKEGLFLAQQKDYDIVLVDLGMPDISGVELAAQVKATNPKTQIALVTGWGVQLDLSDLRERGVTNVVAKPFTREEVLTIVRQLLNNQAQPNEPGTLVR